MPSKIKTTHRATEDDIQITFFQWIAAVQHLHPALPFVYHTPNGGSRNVAVAAKLKRMGTKRGICDLKLELQHGGYVGWAAELKAGENKLTPEQQEYMTHLQANGWKVGTFYTWVDAAQSLCAYLGIDPKRAGL